MLTAGTKDVVSALDAGTLLLTVLCGVTCTMLFMVYFLGATMWGLSDKFSHLAFFSCAFIFLDRLTQLSPPLSVLLLSGFAIAVEASQWVFPRHLDPIFQQPDANLADLVFSIVGIQIGKTVTRSRTTVSRIAPITWVFIVTISAIIDVAYNSTRSFAVEALVSRAERQATVQYTRVKPWPNAPASIYGHLELTTIGTRILLLDNASPPALALRPGVWSFSARGLPDFTVVLGHRNREFFDLALLKQGDEVSLAPIDSPSNRYRVSNISIVQANRSGIYPLSGESGLLLITCWPVDQTTPTEKRLVIHLDPVD